MEWKNLPLKLETVTHGINYFPALFFSFPPALVCMYTYLLAKIPSITLGRAIKSKIYVHLRLGNLHAKAFFNVLSLKLNMLLAFVGGSSNEVSN